MTAILTVQGLEKRFGLRRVLHGASFAVHERDRIGMIGANGVTARFLSAKKLPRQYLGGQSGPHSHGAQLLLHQREEV